MNSDGFELPSFAKVNLTLRVLGRRDDGFHEVFTILQMVSLHDTLRFELMGGDIRLTCDDARIPTDSSNIVLRAAEKMRSRYQVSLGASIHIEKRIPSPGGLGGGSSNAAVTLLALNRLWKIDAPIDKLSSIGSELGADVPFFLHGGTAHGTGTGSTIEPTDDQASMDMIIVTPDVSVSTRSAYASLAAEPLTNADAERILLNYYLGAARGPEMVNDFEKMVFAAFPEIERVKATLLELGAETALMSGSGASVFGIFDNEETRQTALKALGTEANWRSFAVAAISRSKYREALKEVL